ncbi:unnamed protein product [Citrullus colocynthis]|uniref:Uncharacterized protein n=1 Tax=Citrullus colocynthis TaxID=252529 RepID=A0ABP0XUV0_9ROSI
MSIILDSKLSITAVRTCTMGIRAFVLGWNSSKKTKMMTWETLSCMMEEKSLCLGLDFIEEKSSGPFLFELQRSEGARKLKNKTNQKGYLCLKLDVFLRYILCLHMPENEKRGRKGKHGVSRCVVTCENLTRYVVRMWITAELERTHSGGPYLGYLLLIFHYHIYSQNRSLV